MKKNTIIILALAVIVIFIGFKLASNKKKLNEKNKPVLNSNVSIPVTVTAVASEPVSGEIVKVGTALPYQEADIMASSSGKIAQLAFDLGNYVQKGAVIVALDNKINQLNLEASELNYVKLRKDYEKYNELLKGNAATETQVNDLNFNYKTAENKVEQIKKQIADAHITAPISGRIVKKNFEEGEYVNPGVAIGTIVDISRLKVKVMASEPEAYIIKEGQPVTVRTDVYPDEVFEGKITYISPLGDDAHNYPVEVTINNTGKNLLKAGTYVTVQFGSKNSGTALQIPRDALPESIKNPYVYVVEGEVVRKRIIKTGREFGEKIEVLNGLKEGERVVTNGQINLSDGQKVEIAK